MKVKWKKLGIDTLVNVTMPLWLIPAVIFIAIGFMVEGFVNEYVEDSDDQRHRPR